jgi:hypothetical protein
LFYRDRAKFDNWALQVDLYLRFNPAPTDEDAALLAAMYLRGRAEQWIKKFVKQKFANEENTGILNSWTNLRYACERMFGNATEVTDAARLIQLQKQTGSVRDYAAKFQELAVVLDWNDAALMEMYRKGLRDDVKDELMRYRTPVDNLGQMIEATSIIGDQLYERHLERKYDGKTTRAPAYRNTPNIRRFRARPRDPDAMEIDNL